MKKGFFGIGILHPKFECNVGGLFRSAYAFGADFLFTIGRKYKKQSADTVNATGNIPYYHYLTFEQFKDNLPNGCRIVCVEIDENARELKNFVHPVGAAYLLGNEGNGIPQKFLKDNIIIKIPSRVCLNVSVAGSIVLYDRVTK